MFSFFRSVETVQTTIREYDFINLTIYYKFNQIFKSIYAFAALQRILFHLQKMKYTLATQMVALLSQTNPKLRKLYFQRNFF